MKKILTLLIIATLATASFAQTTVTDTFGIELGSYEDLKIFNGDTTSIKHELKFMYPLYGANRVIFVYDRKSFVNDSTQFDHKGNIKLEVPLNATIEGKTVREWLQQTISAQDSLIYRTLATKLYEYKVIGTSGK